MFNEELIAARLDIIHSAIRRLQLLARMPREQFLQDDLQNRLGDFTLFCQHIVNYLERR
ncbi:hypothetical protein [Moorella sp. ACPs]|uniref:hypothetical protein n=1 Tax=Neomoorella carbonis TaxID=3062783 RepID=UPI003251DC99